METLETKYMSVARFDDHRLKGRSVLPTGGDGGNDDGMEARVTALEDIAKDTRSSLESIQRQLARMDERMNHMPKTKDVYTIVFAVYGLSFSVIAAAAAFFALIK